MLSAFALLVGLLQPAGTATLELSVSPPTAVIYVDGQVQKTKPGTPIQVKPGRRVLRATAKGYQDATQDVAAKAGQTHKIKLSLTKEKGAALQPRTPAAAAPPVRKLVPPGKSATPEEEPAKSSGGSGAVVRAPVTTKPIKGVTQKPGAKGEPTAKDPAQAKPATTRQPVTVKRPAETVKQPVTTVKRPAETVKRPVVRPSGDTTQDDAPVVPAKKAPQSTKPYAVVAWLAGGVMITGGVLAGTKAQSFADSFNDSVRRREKQKFKTSTENWALGANVLYGAGAVAAAAGALLWVLDPADRYQAQVAPLPGGGAFVGLGGAF